MCLTPLLLLSSSSPQRPSPLSRSSGPSGPFPPPGAGRGEPMKNGPGYSWRNRQCDDSRCRLSSFSQPPRDLCVDTYVQNMSKGCQLLSASSQCALLECLKINTPRNLRYKIRGLTTERSFFSLLFSSPDWRMAKVTGRLVAVSEYTGQMGQSAACMSG